MKAYLTKSGIRILDWTGNRPEFNLTGNCWSIMDTKIAAKKHAIRLFVEKAFLGFTSMILAGIAVRSEYFLCQTAARLSLQLVEDRLNIRVIVMSAYTLYK